MLKVQSEWIHRVGIKPVDFPIIPSLGNNSIIDTIINKISSGLRCYTPTVGLVALPGQHKVVMVYQVVIFCYIMKTSSKFDKQWATLLYAHKFSSCSTVSWLQYCLIALSLMNATLNMCDIRNDVSNSALV